MAKLKVFNVWAKHDIYNSIPIKAESLEDAVARAKELKDDEFVTVHGDYCDGTTTITGVLED